MLNFIILFVASRLSYDFIRIKILVFYTAALPVCFYYSLENQGYWIFLTTMIFVLYIPTSGYSFSARLLSLSAATLPSMLTSTYSSLAIEYTSIIYIDILFIHLLIGYLYLLTCLLLSMCSFFTISQTCHFYISLILLICFIIMAIARLLLFLLAIVSYLLFFLIGSRRSL